MSKTTIPTGGITADAINATLIADDAISEEHIDATVITASTALAAEPADTDEFLISDAGTIKRIDYSLIKATPGLDFVTRTSVSSNTGTVEFTGLDATGGGSIRVVFNKVITDTSGGVNMQFVVGDNSSYETGANKYQAAHTYNQLDSADSGNEQASQTSFRLVDSIGSDSDGCLGGYFDIFGFADGSTNKFVTFALSHFRAAGGRYVKKGGGFIDSAGAKTKLKFQLSSGNYTAGEFMIYRHKES